MTAPNLAEASDITGATSLYICTLTHAEVLLNPANSNKVYKISTVRTVNVSTVIAQLELSVFRASTHYYLADSYSITSKQIFSVLDKNEYIWLNEGDALYASSDVASALHLTVAYEILG